MRRLVEAALQKESDNNCRDAWPQWLSPCCILSIGISLLSRPHGGVIQVIWMEADTPYFEKGTVQSALCADREPAFLRSTLMTRDAAARTQSKTSTAPCSDVTQLIRGRRSLRKEPGSTYPQADPVVV